MEKISVWIRNERKSRKLSQAKFAKLLGLRQYILSAWELGKTFPNETELQNVKSALILFDDEAKQGNTEKILKRKTPKNVSFSYAENNFTNGNKKENNRPYSPFSDMLLGFDMSSISGLNAISLFSGCGGFSLGFHWAGVEIAGYVELVDSARNIYQENFPDSKCLGTNIREITNEEIKNWKKQFGHVNILFGGPPCQGFSLAGKRDKYDPRNDLYKEFVRVASILKPDVILMENVRLITSMKAPDNSLITDHILRDFDEAGYRCKFQPVNAKDYGVPQFRERVFFIGVRKDFSEREIVFPEKTHGLDEDLPLFGLMLKKYVTFRDATFDLESLESGELSHDEWHFAVKHPDHVIRMLKDVREGGSAHDNPNPKLRPTSGYNTTYKRLIWDEPSSTISTNFGMISGSRNVHPTNTRSLTIREALRCQSFPDTFKLCGTLGEIRTAIGNAVPPLLAKVLAEHLIKAFFMESIKPQEVYKSSQPVS
jgi:DNA (cytosine-5)-methyltransferase 1